MNEAPEGLNYGTDNDKFAVADKKQSMINKEKNPYEAISHSNDGMMEAMTPMWDKGC